MRCPECKALNEAEAAACTTCGLLLINVAPKRRSEDLAVRKRRASDTESGLCRFCGGAIPSNAIRCKHCGELLDEEFYRERATRIRSRVNYASWVMYLFGLAALLVFRPVGVVSIAIGLLLSITYYAIPVEPPGSSKAKREGLAGLVSRQLKFERVSVPLPAFRKLKLVFVGTPLVAALIGYMANSLLLQEPVNDIIAENAALQGMKVSAHYQYWVVPGVVVYDLKALSFRQTPIDVHTAFLEFAGRMKEKRYSRVELSYQGNKKYTLDGAAFAQLGEEYSKRNFDYVLYDFPRMVDPAAGTKPIPSSTNERDALLEFHRQWYGRDLMTKTVANGL
jgi:predicted nucleic acid-binding Zn ribbon protein